jgi:hypothetical protein
MSSSSEKKSKKKSSSKKSSELVTLIGKFSHVSRKIVQYIYKHKIASSLVTLFLTVFALAKLTKRPPEQFIEITPKREIIVVDTKYSKTKLVSILTGLLIAGLGVKYKEQIRNTLNKLSMQGLKEFIINLMKKIVNLIRRTEERKEEKVKEEPTPMVHTEDLIEEEKGEEDEKETTPSEDPEEKERKEILQGLSENFEKSRNELKTHLEEETNEENIKEIINVWIFDFIDKVKGIKDKTQNQSLKKSLEDILIRLATIKNKTDLENFRFE